MKIISKFKDYYDYIKGIWGEDEKLILDRRDNNILTVPFRKVYLYIAGNIWEGWYDNNRYYWGFDLEEIGEFTNRKLEKYGRWVLKDDADYVKILPEGYNQRYEYIKIHPYNDTEKLDLLHECPLFLVNHHYNRKTHLGIYKYPILQNCNFAHLVSPEEMWKILQDWLSQRITDFAGAFFTPWGLARDFSLEIVKPYLPYTRHVVDLCAGIGMLSYFAYHWRDCKVTCIEYNSDYIRVGKKLLPEANWIHGSILDADLINSLPQFDQAISNPPFGKIKTGTHDQMELDYKGSEFEFKAISVASKIADHGTFLIPQRSTPYKYSGNQYYEEIDPMRKVKKFIKETKLKYHFNIGIDTGLYINQWKGVSPMCEVVNFDFNNTNYYE